MKQCIQRKDFHKFYIDFFKNIDFAYSYFGISSRLMIGMSGENDWPPPLTNVTDIFFYLEI